MSCKQIVDAGLGFTLADSEVWDRLIILTFPLRTEGVDDRSALLVSEGVVTELAVRLGTPAVHSLIASLRFLLSLVEELLRVQ